MIIVEFEEGGTFIEGTVNAGIWGSIQIPL
jgi:hypothetical protein